MRLRERPVIGITTGAATEWAEGGRHYESYAEAVRQAGGEPVRLAPGDPRSAEQILREVDGILLAGGPDVDLRLYPRPPEMQGRSPEELMDLRRMRIEPDRDRLELSLARGAAAAGRPALGICRGCQVLNVAFGGSLILDIPSEVPGALGHSAGPPPDEESARHEVEIMPETALARALGFAGRHAANSRHHQAVPPDTARGLRVSAVSPGDGIVEAIEATGDGWILGVQWHPERPADADVRRRFAPLFEQFVSACREQATR
jgi:putative glutamine amidotransferase